MNSGRFFIYVLFVFAGVLPFLTADTYPKVGKVANVANYLNVRSEPKMDASVMGKLKNGDEVVVLGKEGEFYKLQSPKQLDAWIATWMLLDNASGRSDVVSRDKVNVRGGPGMEHGMVCQLDKGDKVDIVEVHKNKWAKISMPTKAVCWVSSKFIESGEPLKIAQEREKRQSEASQLLEAASARLKTSIKENNLSDEDYNDMKTAFDRVVQMQPNGEVARQALENKAHLEKFWGLKALDNLKKAEEEKTREKILEITTQTQKEIDELKKPEPNVNRFQFEGWIESVGGILFHPASHRLKEGGIVLYYLKTLPNGPNMDKFDGKRVGLNGKVERFRGFGRIITVEEIEVLYEDPDKFWTPN